MSKREGVRSEHWQAGGALGDVVLELQKEKHLTTEQVRAALSFLRDLRSAYGSSAGVVGQIAERVDASLTLRLGPPGRAANASHERMSYVLRQLRAHERETLHFLIMRRELPRGGLSDLGRIYSGYRTQRTMRAAATGQVRALLATVAELYASPMVAAA